MRTSEFDVIYLTGAPATGKSTLLAELQRALEPIYAISYSRVLADYIKQNRTVSLTESAIRQQSSQVVTRKDVEAVDELVIHTVETIRSRCNVVVDSHPVTKETYGFRVTPFAPQQLLSLRPTLIINLYASPETIVKRIRSNPQGRPMVSEYEAAFHNSLQGTVALSYGMQLGVPVYMLDSSRSTIELVDEIMKRLGRTCSH